MAGLPELLAQAGEPPTALAAAEHDELAAITGDASASGGDWRGQVAMFADLQAKAMRDVQRKQVRGRRRGYSCAARVVAWPRAGIAAQPTVRDTPPDGSACAGAGGHAARV